MEIDGENAARIIALRLANANLLGIVEQGGIVNTPDLRPTGEVFGDALGILALAVHPQ